MSITTLYSMHHGRMNEMIEKQKNLKHNEKQTNKMMYEKNT